MKQLFRSLFVAVCLLCGFAQGALAQQMPPIPVDPDVRIGKLDNGLTYYIRRNTQPEERADFYIAQKVGSIQEEPEQSGLAHFLEHMAFNGATHFPGDALKQYLETIGVKFGENLNAYTSVDETVYNITNVPITRAGAIDSCLYILHDWSNDLLLEPEEIDKERGVINEEWRTRMSAGQRMMAKALPQMFAGTKYEDCFPIGSMEVVNNFPYQTLRDYYEKWYRPDLQGIVIVGDIDVEDIEARIRTIFADIPAQPNAAERIYYPVNDNVEPIIVIEKDKEQPYVQAMLFNKHEATPDEAKGTLDYLVQQYAKNMITTMLNTRLDELRQSAEPPFIHAATEDGMFFVAKTKDAFTGYVVCKEDDMEGGITTVLREIERAHRFGFTEGEYSRAKADYLRQLESAFNEKDKRKNREYVNEYVRHFLDNEPIPSIEDEYTLMSQIAPNIPVEALNQMMTHLVQEENRVIVIFGPDKEELAYPSHEEILAMLKGVQAEELTAYVDTVSDEPLLPVKPTGGQLVAETYDDRYGTTEMVLSNGVKVILKKTDFKADEILMKGVSLGGTSLYPDSEAINISNINSVAAIGGLGNFSAVDLDKVLAGKKASASVGIGDKTETISGSCSPKDFETLMELTYLRFTAPRQDPEAFESYKNRTKATLLNQEMRPMVSFMDSIRSTVYMNHPRMKRTTAEMVDQIDYDRVMEMYKDRFSDASDFTFIFVGNIEPDELKPLIVQYLGALPATNRQETFKDSGIRVRSGIHKNEFLKEQETPKASVFLAYSGACEYNLRNKIQMSMLDQILDLIYTEKVREDEGDTYGVYVGGSLDKYPREEFLLQIMFDTDPARKDQLTDIILSEIDAMVANGPSETDLNKVKEYMQKKHMENLKENRFWLGLIDEYLFTGTDNLDGYDELVNSITTEDIRAFAARLFDQKNRIEVTTTSPQ